MRTSALLSGAFAGCTLASPLVKRDVVMEIDTVTDVYYVTETLTQTAGASPIAIAVASAVPVPALTTTSAVVVPTSTSTSAVETPTSSASSTNWFESLFQNRHSSASVWSSAWTSTIVESASAVSTSAVATSAVSTSSSVATPIISLGVSLGLGSSSTSESVASTSATSSAASSSATSYSDIVVAHHNVHRSNHSASALSWDADLAATAASIAATCIYEHNTTANGGGYGQNIAAGVASDNVSAVISDLFYNGEVNYFDGLYGEADPDMTNFEDWGHFSQIVWKDTTAVGCATYDCSSSGLANTGGDVSPYFTVCNYSPAGKCLLFHVYV